MNLPVRATLRKGSVVPVGWWTVRVFISLTFRDTQAEHDHLARFVLPRLRDRSRAAFIS